MRKINVLEFANVINKNDFIDTIIQNADNAEFQMDVCVRTEQHNIAVPVFPTHSRYRCLPGISKKHIPFTAWKLSRLLKEWDIDILHVHHFDQAIIGWLAILFYPKTRLVIGRHYSDSLYRIKAGIKSAFYLWIEKRTNKAAKKIIVPSKFIYDLLVQRQKINTNKVEIIPYGFEPEKYILPSGPDIVEGVSHEFGMTGRFVIGNFSRLHEEKGHIYLIEAAKILKKKIPGLLVLIVGEGPDRMKLERLIVENKLEENVVLVGWRKDAIKIMKAVDIVVQPTLQEAFSQVMCEAMWLNKPLIMTDVSGVSDVIRNGENGLIVPKENAIALADTIEHLYIDEGLRSDIALKASLEIKEKLAINKVISRFEQCFINTME